MEATSTFHRFAIQTNTPYPGEMDARWSCEGCGLHGLWTTGTTDAQTRALAEQDGRRHLAEARDTDRADRLIAQAQRMPVVIL